MKFPIEQKFKLSESFIEKYKSIKPPFGFNGLGEFVFMRTYSRIQEDGTNEAWWQVIQRVVEGVYSIQKQHIEDYGLGWNQSKAQKSAQIMYDKIFNMKMLPSGRALWTMGTPLIMEKGLTPALFNCSFLSTKNIKDDVGLPFANAMDFLMSGVGVGFDTQGVNKVIIQEPREKLETFVISDDREGWVEALRLQINSFFGGKKYEFDYSLIRPAGEPIKTFGGTSSGYKPLKELLDTIFNILTKEVGKELSVTNIVDIFNLVGKAVVAGNVRRSAELALGENTEEFLNLKNYELHPARADYGWASNNSVLGNIGMDYSDIADRIRDNAEPGIVWLENFRNNGRMGDGNNSDHRIEGANPCVEIGLESNELCNLVEMFPNNHASLEEFQSTVKYAYLFAKTITLLNTQWQDTNRVMLRNRRIGLSITGVSQFLANNNIDTLKKWMETAYQEAKYYDRIYSDWFAIPESIKITTAKPSGTLSLLVGATPGIHFPESQYYIRRVRLGNDSPFIKILQDSGYHIEKAIGQEESTSVVSFPVFIGENVRTINDVSMWEQLGIAAFVQKYFSDNSVSVTITFKPEEAKDIKYALDLYQYQLKAVSFLPKYESTAYPQMPYEEITQSQYEEMKSLLQEIDFSQLLSYEALGEKYCTNDSCTI